MKVLADFVDDVEDARKQMERVLLEYRAGIYTVDLPSRRVWKVDDLILALADEVVALRQARSEEGECDFNTETRRSRRKEVKMEG
ncbi:MAG: hypothetical protein AAF902_11490 [Chloroflexota bacterium]